MRVYLSNHFFTSFRIDVMIEFLTDLSIELWTENLTEL